MTSRKEEPRYVLCSGHNGDVIDGGDDDDEEEEDDVDDADDDLAVVEDVLAKFLDPVVATVGFW